MADIVNRGQQMFRFGANVVVSPPQGPASPPATRFRPSSFAR